MFSLWSTLIPLILGCALVPVQSLATILLLQSEDGRRKATAWVIGMTSARVVQGLLFALLLHTSAAIAQDVDDGPGAVASFVLLLVAMTMLLSALGAALRHEDPDAPPPRWLGVVDRISPANAFGIGTAMIVLSVKFWVFTVGAVTAIAGAGLPLPERVLTFALFIVLGESTLIALLAIGLVSPARAKPLLDRIVAWLTAKNRVLVMTLGTAFGIWFLVKALHGLGVLT
ncbi:GAP family protein [Angustibacter sp. McL0619]|uniref:GAP family protein n=1 Tax=Angustibacter sp. McL0619 TaxID=3415676 RepID=UPI003CEFF133